MSGNTAGSHYLEQLPALLSQCSECLQDSPNQILSGRFVAAGHLIGAISPGPNKEFVLWPYSALATVLGRRMSMDWTVGFDNVAFFSFGGCGDLTLHFFLCVYFMINKRITSHHQVASEYEGKLRFEWFTLWLHSRQV